MLGMYNQAHEYIKGIVYKRNLPETDVRDIINDIKIKNKRVFARAVSVTKEAGLLRLLFRIYGINLGLLRLFLTYH